MKRTRKKTSKAAVEEALEEENDDVTMTVREFLTQLGWIETVKSEEKSVWLLKGLFEGPTEKALEYARQHWQTPSDGD